MTILDRVAGTQVSGAWYRSVPLMSKRSPLAPSNRGARWLAAGRGDVLYLGAPRDSIIIEMYRHLVDDVEGMDGSLVAPRLFVETQVRLCRILDLTSPSLLAALGLDQADLRTDVGDYESCQRLGSRALEAGFHGILAPAATGQGVTLAVFVQQLDDAEFVGTPGEIELWNGLPDDPRPDREHGDRSLSWQEDALCATTEPETFFPEKGGSTRDAKAICRECKVRTRCLDYALEYNERFGIWGGLNERERRKLQSSVPSPATMKQWEAATDWALTEFAWRRPWAPPPPPMSSEQGRHGRSYTAEGQE